MNPPEITVLGLRLTADAADEGDGTVNVLSSTLREAADHIEELMLKVRRLELRLKAEEAV